VRLVRLELFGFKSFLNRTVFRFNDGITSIVGPNGCGKSNVVDSIIWVLGERGTKSLRVKDMGDVIFHGSNGKRPVNIAEVTLELSDMERDFVVKRRIYRDGVNEYYLNGNLVRLKDIHDFFLGTGMGLNSYAIVEQGKIEQFIHMKPLERRVLIEEVSGITRFEEKKRDAMVRLEEVRLNLERVEDIYGEAKKSFEKAETEWERWKAYKVLADRLEAVDVQILADGSVKLAKRLEKMGEKKRDFDEETGVLERQKEGLKEDLETKEREFTLADGVMRQLELDIKGKEKDMESRLLQLDYLRGETGRLNSECSDLLREGEKALEKVTYLEREIASMAESQERSRAFLKTEEASQARAAETLDALKERRERAEKKVEELRVQLFVAMSGISEVRNHIAEAERANQERKRREQKRSEELQRLRDRLTSLQARSAGLEETLKRHRDELALLIGQEKGFEQEKARFAGIMDGKKQTLQRLRGEKEGKEAYLRQIEAGKPKKKESMPSEKRLVDVLRIDEDFDKALERFFVKELEYYVLFDDDPERLAFMAERFQENFIFFPGKGIFSRREGDVSIEAKPAAGIEEALKRIEAGEEGVFVTGNACVDSRGLIIAEREDRGRDLKRLKERIDIERDLKAIRATLDEEAQQMAAAEQAYGAANKSHGETRRKRIEKEQAANSLEKELIVVTTETGAARERLGELSVPFDLYEEFPAHTIEDLEEDAASREEEKAGVEKTLALSRSEVEAAKKGFDEALSKWHQRAIDLERQKNVAVSAENEIERKRSMINALTDEAESKNAKVAQAKVLVVEKEKKMKDLELEFETLKAAVDRDVKRYQEMKEATGSLHMEKNGLQERIDSVDRERERVRAKAEGMEKDMAVLGEKLDMIYGRLKDAYGIEDVSTVVIPPQVNLDRERESIQKEMEDLGEVNFRAEKEYHETADRIVFLEQQKKDLSEGMESLKKTITKIDGVSRDMFMETFQAVNDAFKSFTSRLFRGGRGHILLGPETAGIEMYVQPPGKRVTRMELLSGGEKALISLSFLLSLMDTKPSPFTLLDEIDAPLDDANLMSLLEIVKDMGRKTQILFITHNRITMTSSDTVYGITMEEEGISKTISVRL
jgi:chromosome segregation protein